MSPSFLPPFCANPDCVHHSHGPKDPYRSFRSIGSYHTRIFGDVPRFQCKACGRSFSVQTFRVDYWVKRRFSYEDLTHRLSSCESLRAIGRAWRVAGKSVSNRVGRAARQVLAMDSRLASARRPTEDLAADGFESFCVSQFFPNNIHILVGAESQFVYATDHVTLRRKGRMTLEQKERRAELERRYRADPKGVAKSFSRIASEWLRILSDGSLPASTLWTDEKRDYPRALRASPSVAALLGQGRLAHRTIPSRAPRTMTNPLFPVNYIDRELRKNLHEHVRETTCWGRNVSSQMERLSLYLYQHNYRKPYRVRKPRGPTHAEVAGYNLAMVKEELERLWMDRAWLTHTVLGQPALDTWLRRRTTPLRPGDEYRQRHIWGWIRGGPRDLAVCAAGW